MAKIVYPADLREFLEKMFQSGELYRYLPYGDNYAKSVLSKKIYLPEGVTAKNRYKEKEEVYAAWARAWAEAATLFQQYNIKISTRQDGMYTVFQHVFSKDLARNPQLL